MRFKCGLGQQCTKSQLSLLTLMAQIDEQSTCLSTIHCQTKLLTSSKGSSHSLKTKNSCCCSFMADYCPFSLMTKASRRPDTAALCPCTAYSAQPRSIVLRYLHHSTMLFKAAKQTAHSIETLSTGFKVKSQHQFPHETVGAN